MSRVRTVAVLLILTGLVLVSARAAQADFLGLFPPTVEGICSASTPSYLAVMDSNKQSFVFVFPAHFVPPQGLGPGRTIHVEYKKRKDGALEARNIRILK